MLLLPRLLLVKYALELHLHCFASNTQLLVRIVCHDLMQPKCVATALMIIIYGSVSTVKDV
jgi:hypothetical protein